MNEQLKDNQILIDYLLGTLPDSEAEKFDERGFTDEEFAVRLKAAENDLIDAYLQDELDGATLEKFKSYYLQSPKRREKVEFAKTLQNFAGRNLVVNEKLIADSNAEQKRAGFFSVFNIFTAPSRALGWSFAVIALVLIVLGGLWLRSKSSNQPDKEIAVKREPQEKISPSVSSTDQNSEIINKNSTPGEQNTQPELPTKKELLPKSPTEKPSPQPTRATIDPVIASFVLALPLRGASQIQNISIAKQTTEVAMQLPLESVDFSVYRVALVDQFGKKTWTSGKLKAKSSGENRSLNIRFSANLLKSKIYLLEVSGINSNGEAEIIGNYPFRVVLR